MTSSDKSPSKENQKKPSFVTLIKKNKPESSPETPSKTETSPSNQTKGESRAKKSTNSTNKSQQTTASKRSKTQEKTPHQTASNKTQSKTTIKSKGQSQSPSEQKVQEKDKSKTTAKTQSQSTSNNPQKSQSQSTSKTQPKPPSNKPPKTQEAAPSKPHSKSQNKPKNAKSKTNKNPENESPTPQLKNANIDPIQKVLLYQNKKKQRLGISDYQDQISARDLSLSLTGLSSVAAGSLLQTFLAGSLMGFFPLAALALLSAAFAKNTFTFHRTALDLKREEEAEKKIAQLLKDTYLENGGEIYSLLDENPLIIPDPEGYRQDYLDIGMFLPSGQFLAISVKSLKGEKDFVYIDQKTNILRYRNPHGLKRWKVNPIDELRRQMDWLCENTQISQTPPLGIVTFMAPAKLKTFDDVAYQVGEIKLLELDNILIVREEDLLTLINEVISRRKV